VWRARSESEAGDACRVQACDGESVLILHLPAELVLEDDAEVGVVSFDADGEAAQRKIVIQRSVRHFPCCEDDKLSLAASELHPGVHAPGVEMSDCCRELDEVVRFIQPCCPCCIASEMRIGSDGSIVRVEERRDHVAVRVGLDSAKEVVDEDEEEERTEYAALRYAGFHRLPGRVLSVVDSAHTAIGEEGSDPEPGSASDAGVMDAFHEDVVIDAVKRLFDVEKENGAARMAGSAVLAENALDRAEQVVDGVVRCAALAKAELRVAEVLVVL
jgi:hypothetical protein